jgi:tetratricopeptide (TPR) repeat protein
MKTNYGEDNEYVASDYNVIGTVYYFKGEYFKALEYFNKAKTIKTKLLGESHPELAIIYNNIGKTYSSMEDYGKALEQYNQAMSIYETHFGPEDSMVKNIKDKISEIEAKIKEQEK